MGFVEEEGKEERFYPIRDDIKPQLELYQKKMLCTDDTDLMIRGDYNSNNAQLLVIGFNRCHDRVDCKPKAVIDEFIRGKFLVVMSNAVRFDSMLIAHNAVVKESILTWYPISYQQQLRYPHKISMS